MPTIDDVQPYIDALSTTPFFEDFEPEELTTLIAACERKILAPREALWAVGTPGDAAYFLVDGRIEKTLRLPPDGKRVDQIESPGAMLALSHLVKEWEHESMATSVERSQLLRLRRTDFKQLFDAGESAAYRLVDQLAEQLVREMRDANRRLHEVFGNPAETLRTLRRRVRQT